MPNFNELTYFDYVVCFIFLAFFLRGIWIGCLRQLGVVSALFGGYYLAGRYTNTILAYTQQFIDSPKFTFLVTYGLIFILAAVALTLLGNLLQHFMKISLLGWLDRLGGLVVGGLKALVVSSLIYMFLSSSLSTTNNLLRKSYTSTYLHQGANILRSWIHDPGIQKYFVQKEPAIRADRPSGQELQMRNRDKPTSL